MPSASTKSPAVVLLSGGMDSCVCAALSFDMVKAIRDTLLNYVNAVELQLASSPPEATPAGTPPKTSGNAP